MAYKLQVVEKDGETWYPIPWAAKEIGLSLPGLTKAIDREAVCKKCIRWHEGHRMVAWPDIKKAFYKISKKVKPSSSDESDGGDSDAETYQSVANKRNNYKAELLRLELEEKAGRLIPLDAVQKQWQNIAVLTQKALLSIADRLSPTLVDIQDQNMIHAKIQTEVKSALRNLEWREPAKMVKGK